MPTSCSSISFPSRMRALPRALVHQLPRSLREVFRRSSSFCIPTSASMLPQTCQAFTGHPRCKTTNTFSSPLLSQRLSPPTAHMHLAFPFDKPRTNCIMDQLTSKMAEAEMSEQRTEQSQVSERFNERNQL